MPSPSSKPPRRRRSPSSAPELVREPVQESASETSGGKVIILFILLLVVVIGLTFVWKQLPEKGQTPPPLVPVLEVPTSTESASTSTDPGAATSTEPAALPVIEGMICNDARGYCFGAHVSGTTLGNPFVVTGTTAQIHDPVIWMLSTSGTVFATGTPSLIDAVTGTVGFPFMMRGLLPEELPEVVMLSVKEVVSPSAAFSVPVRIPRGESSVKYVVPQDKDAYVKAIQDSQSREIADTQPVKTVTEKVGKTETPIAASLAALVAWGKKNGLVPNFWPLYTVEMKNGVACVKNDVRSYAGISLTKLQFDPLVKATVKLFSSVKSVDCL